MHFINFQLKRSQISTNAFNCSSIVTKELPGLASVNTRATWWSDSGDLPATEAENVVNLFRPLLSSVSSWLVPGERRSFIYRQKKNQRKYSCATFISSNNKAASLLFLSQQVREKPSLNSRLMSNEKPLIEQKKKRKEKTLETPCTADGQGSWGRHDVRRRSLHAKWWDWLLKKRSGDTQIISN